MVRDSTEFQRRTAWLVPHIAVCFFEKIRSVGAMFSSTQFLSLKTKKPLPLKRQRFDSFLVKKSLVLDQFLLSSDERA